MHILIIGATGNIGQETVRDLLRMNIMPFVGVRTPERAKALFGDKVVIREFDFDRPETFRPAFHGINRVFFIAPLDDPESAVKPMLAEARRSGVKHITFSSGRTTGDVKGRGLFVAENLVRESGIPWTILRPGWFMQNFTGWLGKSIKEEGKLYLPAGDGKTAFIDVRDIAEVVVKTLIAKGHEEKIYELTSQEAYDHHEVMRMIGKVTGREMKYIPLTREAFIAHVLKKGKSREYAEYTANLYDYVREGKEAEVSPDVEIILGKPPRGLPDFIRENGPAWE